ncbi:MAG: DUF3098 domain-containing protein [Saprospiraceae bacterium]|nr:DUF3098 domain-containing protein [Saprospiraceae bacterium]
MAPPRKYTSKSETNTSPSSNATAGSDLLFGKKNFIIIGVGIALIFLGFVLMSGGHMPSPDVWDESLIYSHRRITLAPMLILAGLALQVYAIFAKKD